jgi:predicted negative regulator of RcsB-dependent stress response
MESRSIDIPIKETTKQEFWREALKFGIALVILIVVTYAMWLKFNEERKLNDKRVEENMAQMKQDIETLKKDNKECNDFTKSILLKEIQESNSLQRDLSSWLDRHRN